MSQVFYKSIEKSLKFFTASGLHPDGKIFQKLLLVFNTALLFYLLYLVILLYARTEFEINIYTRATETTFLIFHGVDKSFVLYSKKNQIKDLINKVQYFWKIEDFHGTEEEKDSLELLDKVNKIINSLSILAVLSAFYFVIKPFIFSERVLGLECYKPEGMPFYLLLSIQNWALFYMAVNGIAFDAFLSTMIILAQIQFKFLNYRLKNLNLSRSEEVYLKELKMYIEHHNFLLDFIKSLNDIVSISLLMHIIFVLLGMCVEFYIVSIWSGAVGDLFKSVVYAFAIYFEFVAFYCIPGQILINETDKVKLCAYECLWHKTDSIALRKTLLMIMVRGVRSQSILAGNYFQMNHERSLSTIQKVWSVFMFLQSVQ